MREQQQRYKRCLGILSELRQRLEEDSISQEGLEGATGKPELSPDQLNGKDRNIHLLDIGDAFLLLELSRHPHGGADTVRRLTWLFDRQRGQFDFWSSERP